MLRYNINKISEVDINSLSTFYKKIFFERHKSLSKNWKWWYRVGYNNFEPLIISVDKKVIGQAGLLPADLNINGKKIQAIWFVDFAILPEFRGKGFGNILTKEWMKICPNQITFCNNQSLKIFKKFGWHHNLFTKRLLKPINYFKLIPFIKKIEINFVNRLIREKAKKKFITDKKINYFKIVNNYKTINESFIKRKIYNNDKFAEIVRDEKWLQWRLIECPYKDDLYFFEHKNNFAIVHIYPDKNVKRLNILYKYYIEQEEKEFMALIINWALENDIDLMWTVSQEKKLENIFTNMLTKSVNFASWSSDKKIFDILKNGLLDAQGIDSDIDSSLYIE